jgi:methoxymalonate biosynthesis protein
VEIDLAAAAEWDRDEGFPDSAVKQLAASGLLCADLPERYGGNGFTPAQVGEQCAQVGSVCSSLRGLLTVQGLVAATVLRWGKPGQRDHWLPRLAAGEEVAGFAVTELSAGSDLNAVETVFESDGDSVTVTGTKRWVTCGQIASVFLVLGRLAGNLATVLVEADRAGVRTEPVSGQLGMRAARVAHVTFDRVCVPAANLVAPPGFGLSHVVGTGLDHGRFTVAWGCVGMAEACLRDAVDHAAGRVQGGVALADHQLVRSMLARAAVDTEAARLLCASAAQSRMDKSPDAFARTVMAKYVATRAAASVSADAVQILGSYGCAPDSRAGRFFRDAQVMRIIEGSDQVSELHIADHVLRGRLR